jgi:hypothetical protein
LPRGILATAILICCVPCFAQEGLPPTAEELVNQLGAEGFSARERAEKSLRKRGISAKAALTTGLEHADLEIRLTCHKLLIAALKDDFENRLESFLKTGEANEQGLPGWEVISSAIGADAKAREFYVDMCRADLEMLSALEAGGDELSLAFANRAVTLYNQRSHSGKEIAKETATPILAALLIAGNQTAVKTDSTSQRHIYSYLGSNQHVQILLEGEYGDKSRQVLETWVEGTADGYLGYTALNICLQYELKDVGLKVSRRTLAEKTAGNNSVVPYAAITVGRFGEKKDIASLLPLLENKTVCHSWHNGQFKDVIRIQVRDVALAVLLHMTEQDPAEYGFELLQANDHTLFHIYTAGFVEDEKREAAQKKWQDWAEKNLETDPNKETEDTPESTADQNAQPRE